MNLARYAVTPERSGGRQFPEEPHPYRNDFQRDRDRVVHSKAFRRLEYKTQVFINHLGDNFRTRLTHSIEVAQLSRTVARALGLNEDLAETIALAHDLGHPPFGHAGERALHEKMRDHGGFDHNEQTLRVVGLLEERYPMYPGLNLSLQTLSGLRKHDRLPAGQSHSLEAQIVDICDEIAYNNHDVDDGLDAGYLDLNHLNGNVPVWAGYYEQSERQYPSASRKIKIRYTIRCMINAMIGQLIRNTSANLTKFGITEWEHVLGFQQNFPGEDLVAHDEPMHAEIISLKKYLFRHLYRHPDVEKVNNTSGEILSHMFDFLISDPGNLPEDFRRQIPSEGVHRTVADFIAGMTDRYALQWHRDHLGD